MNTQVLVMKNDESDLAKIRQAVRALESGQLVVFPTETVYGIGCAATPEAIARLDKVKGRAAEKRYTLHIGTHKDVFRFVPRMPMRARQLVRKGLPGPITIVFELDDDTLEGQRRVVGEGPFGILYREGTIGVRFPDNAVAQQLLSETVLPVVAPSANRGGEAPAVTAEEAVERVGGDVDLILDGGDWAGCRYSRSSTVVRVSATDIEVLREGVVSREQIEQLASMKILFLCTGNTCRSPMAEAFCRKILAEKVGCRVDELGSFGYKVASAGVMTGEGMPASPEVIEICGEHGLDATRHRSRSITPEMIRRSDFIFAMSQSHRDRVLDLCPDAAEQCFLLDPGGRDVPDPIGGSMEVYRRCAEQIVEALEKRIDEIDESRSGQ